MDDIRLRAQMLRRRPGFEQGVSAVVSGLLHRHADEVVFHIVGDRGRIAVAFISAYLGSCEGGGAGFTVNRFKRTLSALGFTGSRRAGLLLGFLRAIGYLVEAEGGGRGRPVLLRASPKLMAHFAGSLAVVVRARRIFMVAVEHALAEGDPHLVTAFSRVVGERLIRGERPFADLPRVVFFLERHGGLQVMLALADGAGPTDDLGRRTAVGPSALAERFALSRSQATRILRQARAAGLADVRDDGGHVASPALLREIDEGFARLFALADLAAAPPGAPARAQSAEAEPDTGTT